MDNDLISLGEAATFVGKNLRTIQRLIKAGKLTRQQKDGKNFVSRKELESKFNITATKPQESVVRQAPRVEDYQKKWTDEIQKHAQTREELGVWKGRAEAYQAFAGRLLGEGKSIKKDDIVVKTEPENDNSPPLTKSSFSYYLIFAILGLIFILLIVTIRIYLSV